MNLVISQHFICLWNKRTKIMKICWLCKGIIRNIEKINCVLIKLMDFISNWASSYYSSWSFWQPWNRGKFWVLTFPPKQTTNFMNLFKQICFGFSIIQRRKEISSWNPALKSKRYFIYFAKWNRLQQIYQNEWNIELEFISFVDFVY